MFRSIIATAAVTLALLASASAQTPSPTPLQYDVLISAGHEGRPASCVHFPKHKCNLGTGGEREWTPIVADEATRILRVHGYTVAREPADFEGMYAVKAAVFVHYDGTDVPCTSGASIGYPPSQDKRAADIWRTIYKQYFPFKWQPDNFTTNLSRYYGFRQVRAVNGALVLELGELTCPQQRTWLTPRVKWQGALIAHAVSQIIGRNDIPDPGQLNQ
ncbi:MAG: hypothetical protein JO165_13330 [Candidatus Eremiobacteraeota bacterium]|nr:hypothetical protein [Candidatus Eremiobacteraeota bacterium]